MNSERWICDAVEVGDRVILNDGGGSLLQQIEQRPLNEIGLDVDASLLLQKRIVLGEIRRNGGRPGGKVRGQEPRTQTAPVERFASNAVGLTNEVDIAAPWNSPYDFARDSGIVGGIDRPRNVKSGVGQILNVGWDKMRSRV